MLDANDSFMNTCNWYPKHSKTKMPYAIILYLPTLTHYAWVSRLRTKDIDLTPDSQIRTSCSKKTSFHFRFAMYYFFALSVLFTTITKAFKCLQSVRIVSVQRSWEYLRTFSVTFGSLRKSSEIFGSGSDVFGNPGHDEKKISRIWLRKKLAGIL